MVHLLDANTLIDANRDYYGLDTVPQFWDWLIHMGNLGEVKIPLEIYEELKRGNDILTDWVKRQDVEEALLYDQEADPALVGQVLDVGYGPNLSDIQIEKIGRDPFLIAYALADPKNIAIVTTEVSKPSTTEPSNKKVPDVCNTLGVSHLHTFRFTKVLGFNTNWNA